MNIGHYHLQNDVDDLFALQEKVKKDHHMPLRAVKELYEQFCKQNNQKNVEPGIYRGFTKTV